MGYKLDDVVEDNEFFVISLADSFEYFLLTPMMDSFMPFENVLG